MSFEDCFSSFLPNFWCKYEIFQIFGKIWKKFASSNPFFGWLRLSDSPLTLSGTPCNHLYIKSSSLKNLANHQKRGIRTKLFLSRHEKYTLSHHRITIKIFAFHLGIWIFFGNDDDQLGAKNKLWSGDGGDTKTSRVQIS